MRHIKAEREEKQKAQALQKGPERLALRRGAAGVKQGERDEGEKAEARPGEKLAPILAAQKRQGGQMGGKGGAELLVQSQRIIGKDGGEKQGERGGQSAARPKKKGKDRRPFQVLPDLRPSAVLADVEGRREGGRRGEAKGFQRKESQMQGDEACIHGQAEGEKAAQFGPP